MLASCYSYQSGFNPRTYIRYDDFQARHLNSIISFNPRTYIRYDSRGRTICTTLFSFNPRTYIRYDRARSSVISSTSGFNPRTYIRYDFFGVLRMLKPLRFQSTYLYKVRPLPAFFLLILDWFQSTYLYKVRRGGGIGSAYIRSRFQSTYLYKVRHIGQLKIHIRRYVSIHVPI